MYSTIPISTDAVVAFIRRNAPKGPGGWPDDVLRRWLSTRFAREEMRIVSMPDGRITALAECTEEEDGKINVDLLIGQEWLWHGMLKALVNRFPDWQRRVFTAVRRGKPRVFPVARMIKRLEVQP